MIINVLYNGSLEVAPLDRVLRILLFAFGVDDGSIAFVKLIWVIGSVKCGTNFAIASARSPNAYGMVVPSLNISAMCPSHIFLNTFFQGPSDMSFLVVTHNTLYPWFAKFLDIATAVHVLPVPTLCHNTIPLIFVVGVK